MKKSLLIAIAALFAAMNVCAQANRVPMANKLEAPVATKLDVSMAPAALSMHVNNDASARRVSSVAGEYIMNSNNYSGDFTSSSTFTIEEATGTTKVVDVESETSEETVDFAYNVVLKDFAFAGSVIYGSYNQEDGVISLPVQTMAKKDTYGRIVFSGVTAIDGAPKGYGYEVFLLVGDDGSLSLYGAEDELKEAGAAEGTYMSGYYNFLPDYEKGGAWNYGFDIEFYVPNATMYFSTSGKSLGSPDGKWTNISKRVSIEDYGFEVVVNNFLGLAPVSIQLDGTSCMIPLPQQLDDYDYSDDNFAFGYMNLVGCALDGKSVKRDYTKTAFNGFASNEGMEFFKTEYQEATYYQDGDQLPEGKQVGDVKTEAGYYYVDDDPEYCRYFAVATKNQEGVGAYSMGFCCNLSFVYDNPILGIEAIKSNKAAANASSAMYNMAGQRVDASFKGLVIKDGKKVVLK